jgi:two-component system, LytTR family, sensor kinase
MPGDGRARRGLAAFVFWSLVVFVCTTSIGLTGDAPARGWSVRAALATWCAWALLIPVIVWTEWLVPRVRETLVPRLLLHVPLSLAVSLAFMYVRRLTGVVFGGPTSVDPMSAWLTYWVIAAGYLAFDYHDQIQLRTARTTELERLLAQSRIETLRTQLNPHFLFNALNAVSAHVEGAPRTARWMLEQLGDLLRLSLDHADEQEIPLQQELAFVDRYLKLQKIRFDNRLDVVVDVEPPALRALVPTFILQPLLENAIRHGIARRSTAGVIEIQAWHENTSLHLSVRDDGPGLPADWDPERGLGVGLSNTRERLRRLYGDNQRFEIAGAEGSGVRVDLTLPYRDARSAT